MQTPEPPPRSTQARPQAPRTALATLARLPALDNNCQPGPGKPPGLSRVVTQLDPLNATTSR
jgi:hypothetical protein